jgi:hypothetical protein
MCCLLCIGKWHAEHGRRRRLGRIVIRAMVAFLAGGGKSDDVNKLMLSAIAGDIGGARSRSARLHGRHSSHQRRDRRPHVRLADTLKLTHSDHHPPERAEPNGRSARWVWDWGRVSFNHVRRTSAGRHGRVCHARSPGWNSGLNAAGGRDQQHVHKRF